jgi:phosphatidate cytidylyltransferase
MAPQLSPGKTVAGGIGCLAAAVVAAWVFFVFIAPWMTGEPPARLIALRAAVYGVLLAIVGVMGDLGESLIKRDVQRKDSSSWLPGLGGVLDIMDSLLFAIPVAFTCYAVGLVGPG